MTAPVRHAALQVSPLLALAAQAEALSLLVEAGEMAMDEALESLGVGNKGHLCEQAIEQLAQESKAKENPRRKELRRLLNPNVSFERAWHELNDSQGRPTPSTTIEAIMHCVRESGVAALKDAENINRLSRCDAAAKAQIDRRISKLKKLGRIQ